MLMFIVQFQCGCRMSLLTPEECSENAVEQYLELVPELLSDRVVQSIWMVPNFMDYLEDVR